jgi:YVTN family beta-propeller protein
VAFCYNPTNNKVYSANNYDGTVTVMDGATNGVIATVTTGYGPYALCYNSTNNKVYSANFGSGTVTVIDGANDGVIATVTVGTEPWSLCYDSINNKVYCADSASNDVKVIDGATNNVMRTIRVGPGPRDFCRNPSQDRVYVANLDGSSISVMRGSGGGIEEDLKPQVAGPQPVATVVRCVLFLPEATSLKPQAASLLDISGRKVLDLSPGANDVRTLAPGVYFVRSAVGGERSAAAVRKVVIQ